MKINLFNMLYSLKKDEKLKTIDENYTFHYDLSDVMCRHIFKLRDEELKNLVSHIINEQDFNEKIRKNDVGSKYGGYSRLENILNSDKISEKNKIEVMLEIIKYGSNITGQNFSKFEKDLNNYLRTLNTTNNFKEFNLDHLFKIRKDFQNKSGEFIDQGFNVLKSLFNSHNDESFSVIATEDVAIEIIENFIKNNSLGIPSNYLLNKSEILIMTCNWIISGFDEEDHFTYERRINSGWGEINKSMSLPFFWAVFDFLFLNSLLNESKKLIEEQKIPDANKILEWVSSNLSMNKEMKEELDQVIETKAKEEKLSKFNKVHKKLFSPLFKGIKWLFNSSPKISATISLFSLII